MILVRVVVLTLLINQCARAGALDVPLTVQETGGVDRQQWPVSAGIPLPKGAVRSTEALQILDQQGRFVPAHFSVSSRWPSDGSIHWLLCQFAVSVKANARTALWLREVVALPDFPSPIGFIPRGKDFEVITGPLRLIVGGNSNQLLDQAWVDENWGYDFTEKTKILDSGNFEMVLMSGRKVYKTSEASSPRIEVEEYSPLRAVVKVTGTFVETGKNEPFIDYVSRVTVYGGKTYFKLEFILLNPSLTDLPIESLKFSCRMNLDVTQQKFAFGRDQSAYSGVFESPTEVHLLQSSPTDVRVAGSTEMTELVHRTLPEGADWVDLFDGELGLSIAMKRDWTFRQREFLARSDGTLTVELVPESGPKFMLAKESAQSRELLFHFHGKRHFAEGQVRNVLQGFQKPLIATAPASWYCDNALASGPLVSVPSANGPRELEEGASRLNSWLTDNRKVLKAKLQLGSIPADELPAGDLPHALFLHFFRTLDLDSFEAAEELLGEVSDNNLGRANGPSRVIPRGIAGLLDSYLVTGDRRQLEAARIGVSPFLEPTSFSVLRTTGEVAAVLNSLLSSLEATGDQRALVIGKQLVRILIAWQDGNAADLVPAPKLAESWKPTLINSLGVTLQDHAVVWSALRRYGELMNDRSIAQRLQRSWKWITQQPGWWNSEPTGFLGETQLELIFATGLAWASNSGKDQEYWTVARKLFQVALERHDTFATPFRCGLVFSEGQHFLSYLGASLRSSEKKNVSLVQSDTFR